MYHQQIGRLMLQANFGRTALERPALFLAHHYRLMVALLTSGLLLSHLLVINAPAIIVLATLLYGVYAVVRLRMPSRYEQRFYTPAIQFWRAQLSIAVVTLLLFLLERSGQTGMLWVLYLPALLLISRYCTPQWPYAYMLVAIEVAALVMLARFFELRDVRIDTLQLIGEMGIRVFALLLPSFLVHYLARVDITAKRGALARDQVLQLLLEQTLFETDGPAVARAIRAACAHAVDARASEIYFYDNQREQLYGLDDTGFAPRQLAELPAVESAIRGRGVCQQPIDEQLVRMAVPLYGQANREGPVLAVVVLDLLARGRYERHAAELFLVELLDHIWPICAYSAILFQYPLLGSSDNHALHRLRLNDVLDVVLDTLCDRLGFSFAMISLVDEDAQEITTVRGKHVSDGWINDSHHSLSSSDILADVLRTGNIEVIDHWDARFDAQIWEKYHHEQMIRLWIPLGHIGVMEAGYYKYEKTEVSRLLIELLKQYARDITVAIKNALHYEREQQHATLMARLHEVSYDLHVGPHQRDAQSLLQQITDSALELLGASIVLLYALDSRDELFAAPICAGTIEGRQPLTQPHEHDNIVRYIAAIRAPYYQPDAQSDARLIGTDLGLECTTKHRTFTARQRIVSFAGVPLLAQGRLLGVLCVNYRERHQFSAYDRQAIELFALQAAAIVAAGELVREQERRRLEYDLHDAVKSSVRGMILFSRAASDTLATAPHLAEAHLHQIRRIAWNILSDVDMILKDLSPLGSSDQALQGYIRSSIARLAGSDASKLVFDIDRQLPAFPMVVTRTLLHLIHEAAVNALEHANARTIWVGLHCSGACVDLVVRDNGSGFVLDDTIGDDHRGLAIMQERLQMVGGTLEVLSVLGQGTTIRGVLPLKESTYGDG